MSRRAIGIGIAAPVLDFEFFFISYWMAEGGNGLGVHRRFYSQLRELFFQFISLLSKTNFYLGVNATAM